MLQQLDDDINERDLEVNKINCRNSAMNNAQIEKTRSYVDTSNEESGDDFPEDSIPYGHVPGPGSRMHESMNKDHRHNHSQNVAMEVCEHVTIRYKNHSQSSF